EARPIGAGLGEEDLAFGGTRLARRVANAIRRLQREERLGAMHDVERVEALLQVRIELSDGELHPSRCLAAATCRRIWCARSSCMSLKRSCSSASFAVG